MSRANRLNRRNVHIYDSHNPTANILGGFCLLQDITNSSFHALLDIFITRSSTEDNPLANSDHYYIQNSAGRQLARNNELLQPGECYLVATGNQLQSHLLYKFHTHC